MSRVLVGPALCSYQQRRRHVFARHYLGFCHSRRTQPRLLPQVIRFDLNTGHPNINISLIISRNRISFTRRVTNFTVNINTSMNLRLHTLQIASRTLRNQRRLLKRKGLRNGQVSLHRHRRPLNVNRTRRVTFVSYTGASTANSQETGLYMKGLRLHNISKHLVTLHNNFRLISRHLLLIMDLLKRTIISTRRLMTLRISLHRLRLHLTLTRLHTHLVRTNTSQAIISNDRRITNLSRLAFLSRRLNRGTISLQPSRRTIRQGRQTSTTSMAQSVFHNGHRRTRQSHNQHNRFNNNQFDHMPRSRHHRSSRQSDSRHKFFISSRTGRTPKLRKQR